MKNSEIEAWVFNVIERIKQTGHQEDSRVEVKALFPENISKAARQIAALANASPDEDLLWIVGVNERLGANCVVGANAPDGAQWGPQLAKCFDGEPPHVRELNIAMPDGQVVFAIYFRSDRVPYVVKIHPDHQEQSCPACEVKRTGATHEVPYRLLQNTWSATRAQLMRLLAPLVALPRAAAVSAIVALEPGRQGTGQSVTTLISVDVVPATSDQLSFKGQRCVLQLEFDGEAPPFRFDPSVSVAGQKVAPTDGWITVNTAQTLQFTGRRPITPPESALFIPVRLVVQLFHNLDDRPVTVSLELTPATSTAANIQKMWRGGASIQSTIPRTFVVPFL